MDPDLWTPVPGFDFTDINGMKAALLDACRADEKERTKRMKAMRRTVLKHDVAAWASSFLVGMAEIGRPE